MIWRVASFLAALWLSGSAASATTWDTPGGSNCNANYALSNGNLTATGSAAAWNSCRANTSHASGKWFFRIQINTSNNQTKWLSGIENSSASISNFPGSTSSTGIGCQAAATGGSIFGNSSGDSICGGSGSNGFNDGDMVEFALDIGNNKIWFRSKSSAQWDNSGTANPATNTGGAVFSITGPYFPACGTDANGINCVLDTTGGTPPAGFTVWDGSLSSGGAILLLQVGD